MSGWNKFAASAGFILLLAGIGALYNLAGNTVSGYWWGGAILMIVLGLVILAIEARHWRRRDTPPETPRIKAKDSADWKFTRSPLPGKGPIVEAQNSPGWEFEDSPIGDEPEGNDHGQGSDAGTAGDERG